MGRKTKNSRPVDEAVKRINELQKLLNTVETLLVDIINQIPNSQPLRKAVKHVKQGDLTHMIKIFEAFSLKRTKALRTESNHRYYSKVKKKKTPRKSKKLVKKIGFTGIIRKLF